MAESAQFTPCTFRLEQSLFVGGVAIVVVSLVTFTTQSSNCGGNSAALTACQNYIGVLQAWHHDHPNEGFRYRDAGSELQEELTNLAGADWIRSARLLAKLKTFVLTPTEQSR